MEATYNYETKTLSYKISWTGLSSAVTAIHVHGIADPGAPAAAVQTAPSGFPTATTATYSGTLFADEIVVKQSHIVAGKYYIDIHTANNTNGELRGQITF